MSSPDEPSAPEIADAEQPAPPASRAPEFPPPSRRGLAFALAAGWLVLDIVTKAVAVAQLSPRRPVELVDGALELDLLRNAGSAFSFAPGYTALLSLVAVAVVVVVVRIAGRLRSTAWAIAFGLLLGGALGNLTDRIFRAPGVLRGHVVDFIALPHWPVFNIADSGITIAAVLIVVLSLLGRSYDGTRGR